MLQQVPTNGKKKWFILGHEPILSASEIFSFLGTNDLPSFELKIPVLKTEAEFNASELMNRLGGTIKIGREIGSGLKEEELISLIQNSVKEIEGKITFGISLYSDLPKGAVGDWGKEIKRILKGEGRSVRYVYKNEPVLSSVTVEKNELTTAGKEFLVLKESGYFSVAETVAVQPFESFSLRDYGRPGRDDLSGMLPPKLAIMLLNLARLDESEKLLDPFCGSGTIISEALLLGQKNVYGCDLSDKAVRDSKMNIDWLLEKYREKIAGAKWEVKTCDVRELSSTFGPASINAIVTEPYLGIPRKGKELGTQLQEQAEELSGLYLSAFNEFKKILSPGGRVIFIIPRFSLPKDQWITISDRLVPELEKIGFIPERLLPETIRREHYILYRRPGQFVGREIWSFRLA